jgi:hypothetical protein
MFTVSMPAVSCPYSSFASRMVFFAVERSAWAHSLTDSRINISVVVECDFVSFNKMRGVRGALRLLVQIQIGNAVNDKNLRDGAPLCPPRISICFLLEEYI